MCVLVLAACSQIPPPVRKIALVAPFEGRQRQIGYDAFPALRMAVREHIAANANGALSPYQITFIAYNDNADETFAQQIAHNIVIDPDTLIVIGHLLPHTTRAAQPIYQRAGLPMIVLDDSPTDCAHGVFHFAASPEQLDQVQPNIDAHYRDVSGGPPPGDGSARMYLATQYALRAIDSAIQQDHQPTRAGIMRVLAQQVGCSQK